MESRSRPVYLIIGHITQDLTAEGVKTGGTAAYSGLAAQALGCETLVVTSAGSAFEPEKALPGLAVKVVPASETTTYENIYTDEGRRQYLYKRANFIEAADVPSEWREAEIVHLGPLNMEFDPAIIHTFPKSLVGITPQGWLRKWDESGKIGYKSWRPDSAVLSKAAAIIISEEDIPPDESLEPYLRHQAILVQTRGVKGCAVYHDGSVHYYPAPKVNEVNLTGAGDIFATAFFIRLHQSGRLAEAAEFANFVAAWSVTGNTLAEKVAIIREKVEGL